MVGKISKLAGYFSLGGLNMPRKQMQLPTVKLAYVQFWVAHGTLVLYEKDANGSTIFYDP